MIKRPNPFLWLPLAGILKVSAWLQGGRITEKVKIKKPCIILSNHTSFRDYVFAVAALYPHRVTFMAASKMYYEPERRPFLKMARAIQKASFESDLRAVVAALNILKQGGILSIFPEGQISYHGTSLKPPFSIAKFLKKANVNVYILQFQNNYLMAPPWSNNVFKGKVFTRLFPLFDKEELVQLDESTIFNRMNEALSFNTGEYNRIHRHKYKVQPLDNLDSLLFMCPKCHEHSLQVSGSQIICSKCDNTLKYDEYGFLENNSVYEHFERQRKFIESSIENNPHYELIAPVNLVRQKETSLEHVGQGTLSLNRDNYIYTGTNNGEEVVYTFATKTVEYLPSDIGKNVQIYHHRQIYIFEMADKKLPTLFTIVGEYFNRLRS
ncbi:MAG TPA: lysophospholipid acyltransferase family protein [Bacilli bacterium]|nr:lysophospholipid acyltransferase family protein [Bacilli bacterium]